MNEPSSTQHGPDELSPSSGGRSLEGYVYQLDVSILTALDLILAKKVANEIVLEPATEEDLEADIEQEPGALSQSVVLDGYRLVLQCKLRNTGPWKHEDLSRLLAHGKRRKSARDRLADPSIRYLLVTSADLDGVARQLKVETVGVWPPASALPADMARSLPADAGGRIAILGAMDQEKINARTERLLSERFRVPHSNLRSCREALRSEALLRMRGAAQGVWTRSDVERLIKSAGGYAGESADLEGFVPPTNWDDFKAAINAKHAIVIAGASGTGKTRTAKALIAHLRDRIPGIKHVVVHGGPEKIADDSASRPVVYEIEDPWGRFRLEPTSAPWNGAIAEILQSAGPERKFVITSRSDVLHESKLRLKDKWIITLEDENYGPDERARLFENRLPSLPPDLQPIVLKSRTEAIDRLATPLEMHRYFAVLSDGLEKDENSGQYITRCLSDAHQNSIESALIHNVRQRGTWAWAAITWGLFKSGARQTFNVLPSIQAGLTKHESDLEDGLEPYLNFLIAGRNLRQSEATLTYQHPRVELGLEEALKEKPGLAARVLSYLVEVLIDMDERTGTDWGTEGAAQLVYAVRERSIVQLELPAERQSQLDAWIDARLAETGPNFREDLKLAASVGSANSIPAELSRWLTHQKKDKEYWFFDKWSAPDRSLDWFQKVAADHRTRAICTAFITREIPHHNPSYPAQFAGQVAKLCIDLTPAFMDAALSIVQDGYNPNADLIATGALADLNGFEEVVTQAISYRSELAEKPDDEFKLKLANGEYDGDYGDHYYESISEDGQTAHEFLEFYVAEKRERDGWNAIRDHAHALDLLYFWIRTAERAPGVTIDEWRAIARAAFDRAEERDFWQAMQKWIPEEFLEPLRERLVAGSAIREVRIEVLETALCAAPSQLFSALEVLVAEGDVRRVIEVVLEFVDVREAKLQRNNIDFDALRLQFLAALPNALAEAANAVFASSFDELSKDALLLFERLDTRGNLELKSVQAEALSRAGFKVDHLLKEILSSPKNDGKTIAIAVCAVSIAARSQMWPLVEAALSHRFADVREVALSSLAEQSPGPLSPQLRNLASDKGHRVREKVLSLLQERPNVDNMDAILKLAADTWEPRQPQHEEERDFRIAYGAAYLLSQPPQIGDEYVSEIGKILFQTEDRDVKLMLLRALVRNGSSDARKRVLKLALKTGNPPHHRLAAEALCLEQQYVDAALAAAISDKQLLVWAAPVALPLTVVVGACADRPQVVAAAQSLAAKPDRRVLLIPLAITAFARDRELAQAIIELLPATTGSALSDMLRGSGKLSLEDLDYLADVRTLQVVKPWLSAVMKGAEGS
ncbi:hypothetical protein [Bradyrhizobium zhanjiangense]|uniref:Novel STAND NTPase 3 domain-containing protein n=1 Tax=Bradyrhizobium zhanjiangense TaxID=1325107 RepID=A0A4Q0SVA9_9BRAD|nr:hypothetical protein [Bradyrhizobium zhanjiangense]RXH42738.1 hypothetical protein XH94_00115 [Bradyrhizobium zhanjiangense]